LRAEPGAVTAPVHDSRVTEPPRPTKSEGYWSGSRIGRPRSPDRAYMRFL